MAEHLPAPHPQIRTAHRPDCCRCTRTPNHGLSASFFPYCSGPSCATDVFRRIRSTKPPSLTFPHKKQNFCQLRCLLHFFSLRSLCALVCFSFCHVPADANKSFWSLKENFLPVRAPEDLSKAQTRERAAPPSRLTRAPTATTTSTP